MTSTAGPAAQVWVGEPLWDRLSAEQRDAVVAARTFTFGRYSDDEGAQEAAQRVVRDIAASWVESYDRPQIAWGAAEARTRFDAAQREMVLATAHAQAFASMRLARGASEVMVSRELGINRNTLRRWIGKLASPQSRLR